MSSPSSETVTLNFVKDDQHLQQQQQELAHQQLEQDQQEHELQRIQEPKVIKSKLDTPKPRRRKREIGNDAKQKSLERLSYGFPEKLNVVLNTEINGYGLVNHLNDLQNKSTVRLVQEFLMSDIETVNVDDPISDEILQQQQQQQEPVFTDSQLPVLDPKQNSPFLSMSSSAAQNGDTSQFGKLQG